MVTIHRRIQEAEENKENRKSGNQEKRSVSVQFFLCSSFPVFVIQFALDRSSRDR
jgi:hypothetical protein